MIDTLQAWDQALFLWLNGDYGAVGEAIMTFFSARLGHLPFLVAALVLFFVRYRWRFWVPLLLLALAMGLADHVTSGIMKPYFARLRPCHVQALQDLVYVPLGCGGQYGFASSHASNAMAAGMVAWLFLRHRFQYSWLFVVWAVIVGFSRIYLGKHYPGDVLVGFAVGGTLAYLGHLLGSYYFRCWPGKSA